MHKSAENEKPWARHSPRATIWANMPVHLIVIVHSMYITVGLDHTAVNIDLVLEWNLQEEVAEISITLEKLEKRQVGRKNQPTNQRTNQPTKPFKMGLQHKIPTYEKKTINKK